MTALKFIKVKTTVFSRIEDPAQLRQYVIDSIEKGSISALYMDPNILAAFYSDGVDRAKDIQLAIDAHALSPVASNETAIKNKMALAVLWLKDYSKQVEDIANLPANRTTVEEAATNIQISFLTNQKLESESSSKPDVPLFTVSSKGNGGIGAMITNGDAYKPKRACFTAIQMPDATVPATPDPIVTLINGQLKIITAGNAEVITKTISGKGRTTTLNASNTGKSYIVYVYTQNTDKLVSDLSAGIIIKL